MENSYIEENASMTLEDFEKIVKRIKKTRFFYQEFMGEFTSSETDHASDSFNYAFNAVKDPIIVEADKQPIRWLSNGSSS
jgi:CRISPR/Cas system CSM-associated protein Csm4 (group 5 of RAMP superfamily)